MVTENRIFWRKTVFFCLLQKYSIFLKFRCNSSVRNYWYKPQRAWKFHWISVISWKCIFFKVFPVPDKNSTRLNRRKLNVSQIKLIYIIFEKHWKLQSIFTLPYIFFHRIHNILLYWSLGWVCVTWYRSWFCSFIHWVRFMGSGVNQSDRKVSGDASQQTADLRVQTHTNTTIWKIFHQSECVFHSSSD